MKGPTNAQSVNIDATPTDGSNNPVSSNGVYDALSTKADTTALNNYVTKDTAQTITATKTHEQPILLQANDTDPYMFITSNYPRYCGKNPNNLASADGMVLQFLGYDARDKLMIQQDGYRRGTFPQTEFHTYVKAENDVTGDFAVYARDDGTTFMAGPHRAYSTAHTSDVMTIGMHKSIMHFTTKKLAGGSMTFSGWTLLSELTFTASKPGIVIASGILNMGLPNKLYLVYVGSEEYLFYSNANGTAYISFNGLISANATVRVFVDANATVTVNTDTRYNKIAYTFIDI